MSHISEYDVVFLSYDEPNAEINYAKLLDICPWAKRVHGVKGFDAAHRACAEVAESDYFITVDADNTVRPEFFDLSVVIDQQTNCISWNGLNVINGLTYGNGGLKLWRRAYVVTMRTHEAADVARKSVDFCWEVGYRHMQQVCSDVWNNASAYQAFRVGFREGVKLTLDRGERVTPEMMAHRLHRMNLRNLRIWACVGAHIQYGLWAIYGCRLAWSQMFDPMWDHTIVRDYDRLTAMWHTMRHKNDDELVSLVKALGDTITVQTGIAIPFLPAEQSGFFRDVATGL